MKFPTFPTIIDDCLKFTVADLKRYGYFMPNAYVSGVLNWKRAISANLPMKTKVSNSHLVFRM